MPLFTAPFIVSEPSPLFRSCVQFSAARPALNVTLYAVGLLETTPSPVKITGTSYTRSPAGFVHSAVMSTSALFSHL